MATSKKRKNKAPSRAREVDRILKDNLARGVIAKEDVYFARKFLNVLHEADELPPIGGGEEDLVPIGGGRDASPDDLSADQNEVDFEASLETGTDKDQFDVEGTDSAEQFSNIYLKKCVEWVAKLKDMSEWLNEPNKGTSLNKELNDADREGSIFRGITRKIGANIEKAAGELDKIRAALNSTISSSEKKQRELQKLTKIT